MFIRFFFVEQIKELWGGLHDLFNFKIKMNNSHKHFYQRSTKKIRFKNFIQLELIKKILVILRKK